MAIAPTGAIYKALSFDNVSSRNYGVYITGQAVYNAPTRDVEMISIPGRNGAFALDKGRFENIEVSYPAGIFADNETDFAAAISDFRNFLCSRNGYVRLSDEYNPNEYRMAIYKSGLEVTPAQLKAGEFEIVFDCKPQRWLTSGETAITVSSGDTVTNPTLFDSSPMLEVEGYGEIEIGDSLISISSTPLGEIKVADIQNNPNSAGQRQWTFSPSVVNIGDSVYLLPSEYKFVVTYGQSIAVSSASVTTVPTGAFPNATASISVTGERSVSISMNLGRVEWQYSTTAQEITGLFEFTVPIVIQGSPNTAVIKPNMKIYTQQNWGYIQMSSVTWTISPAQVSSYFIGEVYADSTVNVDETIYIDLDIGEAYKTDANGVTSLNNIVMMPSKLPTLTSGANTITFENTVTDLKITPRWWKV